MYDENIDEYLRETIWDASRLMGNEAAWRQQGLGKFGEIDHFPTFLAPDLELATSPRSPGFFEWERVFQDPDVGIRDAHCCWAGQFLGLGSVRGRQIQRFIQTYIKRFLNTSISY